MRIVLANPRGFCAGVRRAVALVETALMRFGPPIYVRHAIVHNAKVVQDLEAQGVVFVERLSAVPDGATLIFSAHGVPLAVQEVAMKRPLRLLDATCPLVGRGQAQMRRADREGRHMIVIGSATHPEVVGLLGHYRSGAGQARVIATVPEVAALPPFDPTCLGFVTQTTLSVTRTAAVISALRDRFPGIRGPRTSDICYATTNRQAAVELLTKIADTIIVVGSSTSSNAARLWETAEAAGIRAYLVQDKAELHPSQLARTQVVGVTGAASTPEISIQGVVEQLRAWGGKEPESLEGPAERASFPLPNLPL